MYSLYLFKTENLEKMTKMVLTNGTVVCYAVCVGRLFAAPILLFGKDLPLWADDHGLQGCVFAA